jgi:DNA invertase Pin-like site-specific DNA recombinase
MLSPAIVILFMTRIGYARVSTPKQSLTGQIQQLKQKDCKPIFSEKGSGFKENRAGLNACLAALQPGDTLVVTHLDRLSRSYSHLLKLIAQLQKQQIELEFIPLFSDQPQALGQWVYPILSAFTAFDGVIRKDRQRVGVARAKEKGIKLGRKPKLTQANLQKIQHQRAQGLKIPQLMAQYRLSQATIYRALKKAKGVKLSSNCVSSFFWKQHQKSVSTASGKALKRDGL